MSMQKIALPEDYLIWFEQYLKFQNIAVIFYFDNESCNCMYQNKSDSTVIAQKYLTQMHQIFHIVSNTVRCL